MKNLFLVLTAVVGFQTANAGDLEKVLVKGISQSGNLMPGPVDLPKLIRSTLVVNVESGGCTEPEDFVLVVNQTEKVQEVTVVRTKPDFCEAYLPGGEDVELKTTELLAKKPIQVLNPLKVKEQFVY